MCCLCRSPCCARAAQEAAYAGADENAYQELAGPHLIQTLEGHGIPASDIKKLHENGVHTVENLAHAPLKQLNAIKGLSEAKVAKLKQVGAWAQAGPCARQARL